jgi:hypothetical protein
MLTNTERAQFGIIAAVCLLSAVTGIGFFALLVAGLAGYGAVTGTCLGTPYVEKLLDKLGVDR